LAVRKPDGVFNALQSGCRNSGFLTALLHEQNQLGGDRAHRQII
jgi:hypothetical protein